MGTEPATDKLRIGLIADNPNFPGGWEQTVEKVKLADQLGYDSVWMGETWGYDLVARLTELVIATERIKVGAGIFNVSRAPRCDRHDGGDARRAIGRAFLRARLVGRVRGRALARGAFDRPLRRIREYTEIINLIMRAREAGLSGGDLRPGAGIHAAVHPGPRPYPDLHRRDHAEEHRADRRDRRRRTADLLAEQT